MTPTDNRNEPLRAVVFDLFGTLVDIFQVEEHDRMTARMAESLGAPPNEFTRLWVGTFRERVTGRFATTEENIDHVLRELGVEVSDEQRNVARDIRWDFTRESLRPKSGALETLRAIRSAGLSVALISDCSCEVPGLWEQTPFAELFDCALFSCSEGIKKPDRTIYLRACEQLDVPPEACLYVGDGGSNELSGAAAVGMRPLLLYEADEDGEHVYRAGAETWEGERVESLDEILRFVSSPA